MLCWQELREFQRIANLIRRQYRVIAFFCERALHSSVTVKLDHPTLRNHIVVRCSHRHRGAQVTSGRHLTGNKLPPNQLVKSLRISLCVFKRVSSQSNNGGSNGFVRFLCALSRSISNRCLGQVGSTKVRSNIAPTGVDGISAQISRVGSHVCNMTRLI